MGEPAGNAPQCDCKNRHAAVKDGTFFYHFNLEGWCFTDAPLRRATPAAIYFADGNGTHDGEPYTFQECPWCFLELPRPSIDVVWNTLTGEDE